MTRTATAVAIAIVQISTLLAPLPAAGANTHATAPAKGLAEGIAAIQSDWARAMYETPADDERAEALDGLAKRAHGLALRFPGSAEPLVWEGIVLSSLAGARGGVGALWIVGDARKRLESAERIEPTALEGSIYTSLGALYFKVPGWPLSFGDDDKARDYLRRAVELNPEGIDPNFFYGEFLYEQGEYDQARRHLKRALSAAPRKSRPLADEGRRSEIRALLGRFDR